VALIAVAAEAVGSLGLMFRADQYTPGFLLVLFVIWVLSPFVALAWANVLSKRWPVLMRAALYGVTFLITLGSLAFYGKLVLPPAGFAARFRVRGRSAGVVAADNDRYWDSRVDLAQAVAARCWWVSRCRGQDVRKHVPPEGKNSVRIGANLWIDLRGAADWAETVRSQGWCPQVIGCQSVGNERLSEEKALLSALVEMHWAVRETQIALVVLVLTIGEKISALVEMHLTAREIQMAPVE
jgi:hypothetical protein